MNEPESQGLLQEFWEFLRVRKRWWITPIVLFVVALVALIVLMEGSTLAPYIYEIF